MTTGKFRAAWALLALAASSAVLCAESATVSGCAIFPPDNPWNQDISALPVHANSANYIATMLQGERFLHADFGSNPEYGIPFVVVSGTQPKVPIQVVAYPDESDPGPYPVPPDAPVEFGSDHHVLVLDKDNAVLYEMYHGQYVNPGWRCDAGAIFNLKSNNLRPDGWTSCDQAGLPILAGLAKYDEVSAGEIKHALRFTVANTQAAYIHPATHRGDSDNPNAAPMGLRLRLKAGYNLSGFQGQALVVLTALKKYGMFVADTGTDWYITGATDSRWDDTDLDQLKTVPGDAFEAVDTGPILNGSSSGGSGGGGGSGGSGGSDSTLDTDQDGFPDELELALNTSPTDATSTPLGPAYTTNSLVFSKTNIKLNFARGGADSLSFLGSLPVRAGMSLDGLPVVVDVGGVIQTFMLNSRGSGASGTDSFKLRARLRKGTVQFDATASFTAKFSRDSFSSKFLDEGLTGEATIKPGVPRTVLVIVLFNGGLYRGDAPLSYTAVRGKTGKAR